MLGFPKTFRVFLVKTDSHTRLILIRCCHSAANEEKADFFSQPTSLIAFHTLALLRLKPYAVVSAKC